MKMKKVLAAATVVTFLSLPIVSQAASNTSNSNSTSTSGSNAGSTSTSTGDATAKAFSNGSHSMTNTKTTTVTVGNVGINSSDNANNSRSRTVTISGNALSKNMLDETVTNNQHAPIYDNHNPNSINNRAFENASGVMNVSQESGVNNASMQTVNVNNSAGLH